MNSTSTRSRNGSFRMTAALAACVLLAAAVFVFDMLMPLGVAAGVPYVGVVLISLGSDRPRVVWAVALVTTALTLVGWALSQEAVDAWMVLTNRALALAAIWAAALLGTRGLQKSRLIRSRETLLSAVSETIVDGLIVIDARGVIESFNPAAEKLFGYSADEVLGKNVKLLMGGEHRAQHDSYLDHYHRTGERKIIGIGRETEARRKDGTMFPIELSIAEMEIDGERKFNGSIRDITQRKRIELEMRSNAESIAANARFAATETRVLARFAGGGELEDICRDVLASLAEEHALPVSGIYIHDDWTGRLVLTGSHALSGVVAATVEFGDGLVGEAARRREPVIVEGSQDGPLKIPTGIGDITPAFIIASPLVHRERLLGVMVLASTQPADAALERFIERISRHAAVAIHGSQQLHSLRTMTEQLNVRGREILEKNAELERASRLKSEFLANMSHELRTPMNAIIGFSEVLKDGVVGSLGDKQREYVTDIFDSGQHLLSLINDILDLSKIEAGRMELELGPVDLAGLLDTGMAAIKRDAVKAGIRVKVGVEPDLDPVICDGRRMKQILLNLLANAVKFTNEGGTIDVRVNRRADSELGDTLCIDVEDTGIGIPADAMDRLFQPFEQVDGSVTRRYGGTGLGLAMVDKLTRLHGGRVDVRSEQGVGSTFSIVIPWRTGVADSGLPASVPTVSSLERRSKLLIIEDDKKAIELVRSQLLAEPCDVYEARTGEEGLRLARELQPDAILLDVLLPGLDGWAVLEQIRDDPQTRAIPVIIVSIVADEGRGLALGADRVLRKPTQMEALVETVRAMGVLPDASRDGRVLVVDDDPKCVELVATHLVAAGYEVIRASGGTEAIALAESERPGLIVLDLMMPEVSGFEVIDALRHSPNVADVPIVVLTAKELTAAERGTLNGEVQKLLEKRGFDAGQFLVEVRRIIRPPSSGTLVGLEHPSPKPLPPDPVDHGARVALIVEDDPRHASLVGEELARNGYALHYARDGIEALRFLERKRPDLITLDLKMPNMDGHQLMQEIGGRPQLQDVPVVIISSEIDGSPGTVMSAQAVLRKPVLREDLVRVLEKLDARSPHAVSDLLIVDDDPRAIRLYNSYLGEQPFELRVAYDGEEALRLVEQHPPDIMILDLMMPKMSGFEVLQRLRANSAWDSIAVVVVSAKVLSSAERARVGEQAQALAAKPSLDRSGLLRVLQRLIAEKKAAG